MKYSDVVEFNYNFSKSINILIDKKIDYYETTSSKKALNALLYHNAIAIIGPFGSGKSAFLLYLENLVKNKKILNGYNVVKIVADNSSFYENLKEVIFNLEGFDETKRLLSKKKPIIEVLKTIDNTLFLIDEFGKFLENEYLDIQNFIEFINKSNNKLVVALHKSFSEYKKDFSKIQGRFENIIFRDENIESLKILKRCFKYKENELIKNAKNLVSNITQERVFQEIVPLHPFSALAVVEIFNKYFQNQRSIFSFLFSTEKSSFLEFLKNESQKLYSLSELYDYLNYLLEVYEINLIDKEAYYLSQKRLSLNLNNIKKDILKAISIVDIFKLNFNLDEENLFKAFIDRYSKKEIKDAIKELEKENLITFLVNKNSFSLVEDLNIDLAKEIEYKKSVISINDEDINVFLNKKYIAKEFFIEYGNKVEFERVYNKDGEYKVIIGDIINPKSVTINIEFNDEFYDKLKELKALKEIKDEYFLSLSLTSKEILDELIEDKKDFLQNLFDYLIKKSFIIYEEEKYPYSYHTLQKFLTKIAKKYINKTPKINNYTLIHTTSKAQNTSHIKALYKAMLENANKDNLGIEKYPPHKALYLSVIKASGIHKNNKLIYPDKLNFNYVFDFFDNEFSSLNEVKKVVEKLKKEPFCLNEMISLFLIGVYIIVNKEVLSIFDDKGFIFGLNEEVLIHMIKNPKKYKIKKVQLSKKEKKLFNEYANLILKKEDDFNKDLLLSIIKELYKRFNSIPDYSKYTKKLSKKAIKLRSAFLSQRDVFDALFVEFPKSLGFSGDFDEKEYISEFKKYFNEIVLSYKNLILELESFIKEVFLFDKYFPFDVSKFKENEENKIYLNAFISANSIVELIDKLGIILIGKKSENFLDKDVEILKEKLREIAKKMLLNANLDEKNVKINLIKSDKIIEEVFKIQDSKKVDKLLKEIEFLSKNEKLELVYKILEEIQ